MQSAAVCKAILARSPQASFNLVFNLSPATRALVLNFDFLRLAPAAYGGAPCFRPGMKETEFGDQ